MIDLESLSADPRFKDTEQYVTRLAALHPDHPDYASRTFLLHVVDTVKILSLQRLVETVPLEATAVVSPADAGTVPARRTPLPNLSIIIGQVSGRFAGVPGLFALLPTVVGTPIIVISGFTLWALQWAWKIGCLVAALPGLAAGIPGFVAFFPVAVVLVVTIGVTAWLWKGKKWLTGQQCYGAAVSLLPAIDRAGSEFWQKLWDWGSTDAKVAVQAATLARHSIQLEQILALLQPQQVPGAPPSAPLEQVNNLACEADDYLFIMSAHSKKVLT